MNAHADPRDIVSQTTDPLPEPQEAPNTMRVTLDLVALAPALGPLPSSMVLTNGADGFIWGGATRNGPTGLRPGDPRAGHPKLPNLRILTVREFLAER